MPQSIHDDPDKVTDPRRTQWAFPYEPASAEDRAAHMRGAHHLLIDDARLHADMHAIGQPPHPHQHMTEQQAASLAVMGGEK